MSIAVHAQTSDIIDFLNELLEAERAGARVALESARQAAPGALADLLQDIRHDEARWCAMLLKQIERLGGTASPRMGAFHAKAMEIALPAASKQRLTEFFAWKARSIVGRLGGGAPTDYLYADAAQYTIAVAPTDTPDFVTGTGPWHASWGAIYADTLKAPNPGSAPGLRGGHYPEATSYWGNLQPAIAYAVQHQVPGAAQAYQRMTSAANWQQLVLNFDADPVWSVQPLRQA